MDAVDTVMPSVLQLKEHESLKVKYTELVDSGMLNFPFCKTSYEGVPKFLGVEPDTLQASYYVGAEWLSEEQNRALVVTPKLANIDFMRMYMAVLQSDEAVGEFSKFYGIDFDKKAIKTSAMPNMLTPLLMIHFLGILRRLEQHGLKKDYVIREENLQSKVRGKIRIVDNIRANMMPKREDRMYCQFQEYTVDNQENRLLKKALVFSERYFKEYHLYDQFDSLRMLTHQLFSAFTEVSDDIQVYEVKQVKANKMYRDYDEALKVAKMILRRFHFSISNVGENNETTPVFWIDMSRLYECYVYTQMVEVYGDAIKYQVKGYHKSQVDFLKPDERLVIDTKYKDSYCKSNGDKLEDMRQLSGYARDERILKALGIVDDDRTLVSCLVIYPLWNDTESSDENSIRSIYGCFSLLDHAETIPHYRGFYRLGVPLPKLGTS